VNRRDDSTQIIMTWFGSPTIRRQTVRVADTGNDYQFMYLHLIGNAASHGAYSCAF
jgi:hypothetical protein